MKVSDFHFELPEHLIARYPSVERTASRLLSLDGCTGQTQHRQFSDILDLLNPGDLLVFNDTKVIPARLLGQKASGGKVEVLVERVLEGHRALAHIKANKAPKAGTSLLVGQKQGLELMVTGRHETLFEIQFPEQSTVLAQLERHGHMPLPPYIDRPDEDSDKERYQTVYGEKPGAVAAPTAGLHFDEAIMEQLANKGVRQAFVTLHVGAGTFQPVRVENIHDHIMHSEYAEVPQEVVEAVLATREAGNKVVAVGTTSVRSLESAAQAAKAALIEPFYDDTRIFIYPGYDFQVVDAMVTNFHLPESTLMMLVSAFSGREHIMKAYEEAVAEAYRFFSYGDAMFLTRQ